MKKMKKKIKERGGNKGQWEEERRSLAQYNN